MTVVNRLPMEEAITGQFNHVATALEARGLEAPTTTDIENLVVRLNLDAADLEKSLSFRAVGVGDYAQRRLEEFARSGEDRTLLDATLGCTIAGELASKTGQPAAVEDMAMAMLAVSCDADPDPIMRTCTIRCLGDYPTFGDESSDAVASAAAQDGALSQLDSGFYADLEAHMVRACESDPDAFAGPMKAMLKTGGKRLRPTLVLLGASLGPSFDYNSILDLAAAVELLHNASLIIDDIVDDSALRRGVSAVHTNTGALHATRLVLFYYSKCLRQLVPFASSGAAYYVAKGICDVADGERAEFFARGGLAGAKERYYRIAGLKTAALFAGPCVAGAAAAGAPKMVQQSVYDFAWEVGIAFQMVDDLIDFLPATSGKVLAQDLKNAIPSIPAVLAAEGESPEAATLRQYLARQVDLEVEEAVRLVQVAGGVDATKVLAEQRLDAAMAHLANVPDGTTRQRLAQFARAAVQRVT